jgi:hypothetical protein
VTFPMVPTIEARPYTTAPAAASDLYWFQVGAWAESRHGYASHFGDLVTGASVEIRILTNQPLIHRDSDAAYWLGINLQNDAFIQVGYLANRWDNDGQPSWFWEYFPPGTASSGSVPFLGEVGSTIGQNGTWVRFSITSRGSAWSAYVNEKQVGSADLGVANSTIGPYASAEVAQVREADNVLGPVEFRNLTYRDTHLAWHNVASAVALCCYSYGSARLSGSTYPYGVAGIPGDNNHWIAGSGVPNRAEGQHLWPWFMVKVNSPYGTASGGGWYTYGDTVNPLAASDYNVSPFERYHLTGWAANGMLSDSRAFDVTKDMDLTAVYSRQFLVTVSTPVGRSSGSGWYGAGTQASLSVSPSTGKAPGILGALGVRSSFSHWSGDYSGAGIDSTIVVDSPKTIQAVWSYDYVGLLPLVGLIAVVTAVAATLSRRFGLYSGLPKIVGYHRSRRHSKAKRRSYVTRIRRRIRDSTRSKLRNREHRGHP